jgi:hypothetical protein
MLWAAPLTRYASAIDGGAVNAPLGLDHEPQIRCGMLQCTQTALLRRSKK